jgi:site-specific recombinase XerD
VQHAVPLEVLQEQMDHKSIIVTMRYAHLRSTDLLAVVKVWEKD